MTRIQTAAAQEALAKDTLATFRSSVQPETSFASGAAIQVAIVIQAKTRPDAGCVSQGIMDLDSLTIAKP